MSKVIWKELPEFNKRRYEVSNTGLVRSVRVHILKPETTNRGYLRIGTYMGNNKWDHKSVHRLVAEAFIPNPDNKPSVNHKNGIPTDNRAENLEWCTAKENAQHAVDTGLYPIGIRNNKAKLTEAQVRTIRNMYKEGVPVAKLAIKYRMDESTLFDLVKYRTWKHIL